MVYFANTDAIPKTVETTSPLLSTWSFTTLFTENVPSPVDHGDVLNEFTYIRLLGGNTSSAIKFGPAPVSFIVVVSRITSSVTPGRASTI